MDKTNLVMIGMPSSGKTTVGKLLAEVTNKNFIDTDHLIQQNTNLTPKEYVNSFGLNEFLKIQESVIIGLNCENTIIATGGGVIYSSDSMESLKKAGIIIYLKTKFEIIEKRITGDRRLARSDGKSLYDIYLERIPLYEKYADLIVDCDEKSFNEISFEIINQLKITNKTSD